MYLDATMLEVIDGCLATINADGSVDAADYTVWRDAVGKSGPGLAADGSGPTPGVPDGVVDQLDYAYWKANFGVSLDNDLLAVNVVPEPATNLIVLVAILVIYRARARFAAPTDYRVLHS